MRGDCPAGRSQVPADLDVPLTVGTIETWTWDLRRERVMGDRNLALMYSHSSDEVARGVPPARYSDLIHPADRARVGTLINQAPGGDDGYEGEARLVSPDSSVRWIEARGRVERDSSGTRTAVTVDRRLCRNWSPTRRSRLPTPRRSTRWRGKSGRS